MYTNDSHSMQNEGGFMDSSVHNTSTSSGGPSGTKRGDHCIPVMIAHLNRSGEDLQVWGVSAKLISLAAIVTKIEILSTKVTFEFRDETGTISGIKWVSSDVSYESPVKVNSYAKIHGMMRSHNNKNFVLVVNIQPLQELNELVTHLMEVTLVSLEGEKQMNSVARNDQTFINNSMNYGNSINRNDEQDSVPGLNKEQNIVYRLIKNSTAEYGAERSEIKMNVPPYVVNKVDDILQFLSGEGHIYTTSTDDHFKCI